MFAEQFPWNKAYAAFDRQTCFASGEQINGCQLRRCLYRLISPRHFARTIRPCARFGAMPRFFLHLFNRVGPVPDDEGTEVPDFATARHLAVQSVRDILSEEAKHGLIDLEGRIEIADEGGETLDVVPFASAVELRLGGHQP